MGERRQRWERLTSTETEIVRFLCRGLTNNEIGREMSISGRTVQAHLRHVYQKLGVESRSQLMALVLVHREETQTKERT